MLNKIIILRIYMIYFICLNNLAIYPTKLWLLFMTFKKIINTSSVSGYIFWVAHMHVSRASGGHQLH
jgi:hypothetical protein